MAGEIGREHAQFTTWWRRLVTDPVDGHLLDHAHELPQGLSDTANTGGLCLTCHQLETAGCTDTTDSDADGSCTWTTAWGQRIHVPPRSVLPVDLDPPPREPKRPTSDEPPPF